VGSGWVHLAVVAVAVAAVGAVGLIAGQQVAFVEPFASASVVAVVEL
jgi:hypothetical protein